MSKFVKSILSIIVALSIACLSAFSVCAESCGLTAQTGYCFTAKADTIAQGNSVYELVKRQTDGATAQKIYNLMFKAKYRVLDFGGSKWCKGNGGSGITSVYDSGLGQTVSWGWNSWGCMSYAMFSSQYTRGTIGTKNSTGYVVKPSVSSIKSFITNF